MKKFVLKALIVLSLGITPYFCSADVPSTINYQGYLLNNKLGPVNGKAEITFSIGNSWQEVYNKANGNAVVVKRGVFSVVLGSQNPGSLNTVDWLQHQTLTIEVTSLNGKPKMWVQTVPLHSVPYAFYANHAKTVEIENDPTVPAYLKDGVSWDELLDKPTNLTGNNFYTVPLGQIRAHQPLCTASNIEALACRSGCNRWCKAREYSGGTLVEWNVHKRLAGCICVP